MQAACKCSDVTVFFRQLSFSRLVLLLIYLHKFMRNSFCIRCRSAWYIQDAEKTHIMVNCRLFLENFFVYKHKNNESKNWTLKFWTLTSEHWRPDIRHVSKRIAVERLYFNLGPGSPQIFWAYFVSRDSQVWHMTTKGWGKASNYFCYLWILIYTNLFTYIQIHIHKGSVYLSVGLYLTSSCPNHLPASKADFSVWMVGLWERL